MSEKTLKSLSNLRKDLIDRAVNYGCGLTESQADLLISHAGMILEGNRDMRLTGFKNMEEIISGLVLDSLACVPAIPEGPVKIIDLGTGAGIPGIPVKILRPEVPVVLLESRRKAADFLRSVINKLGLYGIEVVNGRAEDIACDAGMRERFDIALARALAPLPVLLEIALPYLRAGGILLAQKGPKAPEELDQSKNALEVLEGKVVGDRIYRAEGKSGDYHILVIEKTGSTAEKYPRRAGIPWKKPL